MPGREPKRQLLFAISLVLVHSFVFGLFHRYDWGHPWMKAGSYAVLFATIVLISRPIRASPFPSRLAGIELGLILAAIVLLGVWPHLHYLEQLSKPAQCDIGTITHGAARMLLEGENPYSSRHLNRLGRDPAYWGYKYGPLMVFAYLPTAFFSSSALKVMTLVYLALLVVVIALLLHRTAPRLEAAASIAFALLLLLIPKRTIYEVMVQGSTDPFPILLLFLSLLFLSRGQLLGAGIMAGLSFSAKFTPGLFFLLLFVRRRISLPFVAGVSLGLLPMGVFLAWDPGGLVRNLFLFHLVKAFDSTSLYSVVPRQLHFLFPLIQILAIALTIRRGFDERLEAIPLLKRFTLLLIVIEVCYREMHTNHLWWFLPPLALLAARGRHGGAPELEISAPSG